MNIETSIADEKARDFITPKADEQMTPEHSAWVKSEIESRMAEKAKGALTYRSLDQVMSDFGFHAR